METVGQWWFSLGSLQLSHPCWKDGDAAVWRSPVLPSLLWGVWQVPRGPLCALPSPSVRSCHWGLILEGSKGPPEGNLSFSW